MINQPLVPTNTEPLERTKKSKLPLILTIILVVAVFSGIGYCLGRYSNRTFETPFFPKPSPTSTCGSCPKLMPHSPDFCKNGVIVPGAINECGCQLPPTCDLTSAKWKPYSNPIIKVSFKYPSDWEAGETQTFASKSVVEFSYQKTSLFVVSVYANYNNGTGKPFASLDEFTGEIKDATSKEISIAGYKAKMVTYPGFPGHAIPSQEALLFTPDNSGIISLFYQADYYFDKPDSKEVLDQILSTFRFD